jgi:pimeloyl-ACP methyl ester carboxylesterase
MIDLGSGTPIVLIPGLQGRWEWMRPAVDAMAKRNRVVSYSLCDERTSPFPCALEKGFENYIDQVAAVMDRAGLERAAIAGVSYGGLIATEFAARHPARVTSLVLASALHAGWQPNGQQRRYLKSPWLMSPLFVATAPVRMHTEVHAAIPSVGPRLRFMAANGTRVAMAPASPSRMARRVEWATAYRFADPAGIMAPALVITGEAGLDRIVPVEITERYMHELPSAERVVLERTGHLGLVTRPDRFAEILGRFVDGERIPA